MTCNRCRKKFEPEKSQCPHCGAPKREMAGTFLTSTVLISVGGSDHVYRSVEEVPATLRTRLVKSTNGANSATILIADRRGRKEIARAMRGLPGSPQRRLLQSVLAGRDEVHSWLTPGRRKAIFAALLLLAIALIGLTFRL